MRDWSESKYGFRNLPDIFRGDFVDHHVATGKKFANASRALQNWINWSSPSGRFYQVEYWEKQIQKAKTMQFGKPRQRTEPPYHPDPEKVERETRSDPKLVSEHLTKMKEMLK